MTVLAEHEVAQRTAPEGEALIKEARRRTRRRRAGVAVAIVAIVALIVALAVALTRSTPSPVRPRLGLPQWVAPTAAKQPLPKLFVTGDNRGGIGVYSTATGDLLRTLSPQTSGGPDQQAVVGSQGRVYFAQPDGACSSTIEAVPLSGASGSNTVVSMAGMLALDPAPSPTSSELAWVGVTCGSNNPQAMLYLSNAVTGLRIDLGPYTGRSSDDGISWSVDGKLLAVEAAPTIRILHVGDSVSSGALLHVGKGCLLTDPAFLPSPRQVAAVRTCYVSGGSEASSDLLAFNAATGQPLGRIATAPPNSTIQSASVDTDGHVLVGVVHGETGADNAVVRNGRLTTISRSSPTGAQW